MKTFNVDIFFHVNQEIEAENKEEALKKAYHILYERPDPKQIIIDDDFVEEASC